MQYFFHDGILLVFDNLRTVLSQDYQSNWLQSQQSLIIKTRVKICPHLCW